MEITYNTINYLEYLFTFDFILILTTFTEIFVQMLFFVNKVFLSIVSHKFFITFTQDTTEQA